jgi:hypothetical protein
LAVSVPYTSEPSHQCEATLPNSTSTPSAPMPRLMFPPIRISGSSGPPGVFRQPGTSGGSGTRTSSMPSG